MQLQQQCHPIPRCNYFVVKEGEAEEYLKRIKQGFFYKQQQKHCKQLFHRSFRFIFGIFLKWDQTQKFLKYIA